MEEQTGRSITSYFVTRWWSRWEVLEQLLVVFSDIKVFLHRNDDLGPAFTQKLLSTIQNQPKASILKIELAVAIDWCKAFVQATYNL